MWLVSIRRKLLACVQLQSAELTVNIAICYCHIGVTNILKGNCWPSVQKRPFVKWSVNLKFVHLVAAVAVHTSSDDVTYVLTKCVCVLFRDFVEQHYVSLKKSNPDFPILIRECSGVQARVWARYGESSHQQLSTRLWLNVKIKASAFQIPLCLFELFFGKILQTRQKPKSNSPKASWFVFPQSPLVWWREILNSQRKTGENIPFLLLHSVWLLCCGFTPSCWIWFHSVEIAPVLDVLWLNWPPS